MSKSIIAIVLAILLAGCSTNVGYNPNVSGQTGRAESDSLNGNDRADQASSRAEAAAKGGEK